MSGDVTEAKRTPMRTFTIVMIPIGGVVLGMSVGLLIRGEREASPEAEVSAAQACLNQGYYEAMDEATEARLDALSEAGLDPGSYGPGGIYLSAVEFCEQVRAAG